MSRMHRYFVQRNKKAGGKEPDHEPLAPERVTRRTEQAILDDLPAEPGIIEDEETDDDQ